MTIIGIEGAIMGLMLVIGLACLINMFSAPIGGSARVEVVPIDMDDLPLNNPFEVLSDMGDFPEIKCPVHIHPYDPFNFVSADMAIRDFEEREKCAWCQYIDAVVKPAVERALASVVAEGGEERFISRCYEAHDAIVDAVADELKKQNG